jgi:hypothetical protein
MGRPVPSAGNVSQILFSDWPTEHKCAAYVRDMRLRLENPSEAG